MGSFSTPVTSFFVRRGSPVTSDKDVELSRQLLLGAYSMCVVARQWLLLNHSGSIEECRH
jgi:hypothetical protein